MEVMTIMELAERLFYSQHYVRELLDEGKLPSTPGPDGEPVVGREVAEQYIAEAKRRRDKAIEEYKLVSSEQHEIEQLNLHFDEYMAVARRATAEDVVRVRCAYEAVYEVMKFAVNLEGVGVAVMDDPDAYARAVVERAATALQLTPEETCQALALNA